MKIKRVFTQKGKSAYHGIEFEKRVSEIKNTDGSGSNSMEVTVPKSWSQVATDIIAQKYFRKTGVPQKDEKGKVILDANKKPILGKREFRKKTRKVKSFLMIMGSLFLVVKLKQQKFLLGLLVVGETGERIISTSIQKKMLMLSKLNLSICLLTKCVLQTHHSGLILVFTLLMVLLEKHKGIVL